MKILKKRILACSIAVLLAGCVSAESAAADELRVLFMNAGKADAILLYTDDSAVLIDCGENGYGSRILSCLKEAGIDCLDTLIITHFDKDHVGGAAGVLNGIEVGEVLVSNSPRDSEEYAAFLQALADNDMQAEVIAGEEAYEFTLDGAVYSIDGPDEESYDSNASNNSSLITAVTYGETSFLFAGDAQNERISEYLEDHSSQYDVLKIPYHGFYQKRLKDLLAITQPAAAVITCSPEEGGEEKTLQLLGDAGIDTYLTWQKDVMIVSDGSTLAISQ